VNFYRANRRATGIRSHFQSCFLLLLLPAGETRLRFNWMVQPPPRILRISPRFGAAGQKNLDAIPAAPAPARASRTRNG